MHPVLLEIGPLSIPTYGVLVASGYLAAIFWLKGRLGELKLTEDQFWSLIYHIFFGAIIGGKLLYMIVEYRDFAAGRIGFLRDFRYGFVFFGGFLGSTLAVALACRRMGVGFWPAADYFGAALPLGHSIGRLGCLASGCCFGKPTTLPWGVVFGGHTASATPERFWGIALHPTQVYESAANLGLFFLLGYRVLPEVQKGRWAAGTVCLGYIVSYSIVRFLIEFLRGDDRGMLGGLSTSQWFALASTAVACRWISLRRSHEEVHR